MGQITRTNFGITKKRSVTHAEMLTLNTVPIVILAGIANAIIIPVSIANLKSSPFVVYTFGAGTQVSWFIGNAATGFSGNLAINLDSNVTAECGFDPAGQNGALRVDSIGQSLMLTCASNPTGGGSVSNTLELDIYYNVLKVV